MTKFHQPAQALTAEMRRRGIIAAIGCTAAAALGLGGLLPLLSITMERMAIPGLLIGMNAMMPFLSAMLVMPFLPQIMRRIPTAPLLAAMILLSMLATISYGLFVDIWLWFPLRFVNGLTLGILFAVSEAWINHFAPEQMRGRIIAVYATVLSGCFACGPLILWLTGTQGLAPYILCAILISAALLPVIRAWSLPQAFGDEDSAERHAHFTRFLLIAPTLTLAGIIYGAVELGVITFMPIYNLRLGLSELIAVTVLTAFSLGNVCCQFPIGWLADKYNRQMILLCCAAAASLSMVAIFILFAAADIITPFVFVVFVVLLFIFGGTAVGIYTMAMVLIGERFQGAELATANAVLVFNYNLGSLVMALIAGSLIDFAPRFGLPLLLAAAMASVMLPTLWRTSARIWRRA